MRCLLFSSAAFVLLGTKTASPPVRPLPERSMAATDLSGLPRSNLTRPAACPRWPASFSNATAYVYRVLRPASMPGKLTVGAL